MSDTHPAPLVPEDVDLRDFSFTPMFRGRLFGSSFHANVSDAGWRAGVTLWLKSWDQTPAGTLPDDEVSLCRLAELGRDLKAWRKLAKEALWGWFRCSDGRLHHRTVAEGVLEAWERKQSQRDRTKKARATALSRRQSQTTADEATEDATQSATRSVTDDVTGSKGQGQGQGQGQGESAAAADPPKPRDPFEAECRAMVGQEPVLLALDFHALTALFAEGLTPDDIRAGIADGLAKADPTYRFRAWRDFAKWARTAGKNRLAGKPRPNGSAPPPDNPDDPRLDLGGGFTAPLSTVRMHVSKGRWPGDWGPPLGEPGCRVPERYWPDLQAVAPQQGIRH